MSGDREKGVRDLVYGYFAEECDVETSEITDESHIIEELDGDSLMLLALLERACKRYGITVELKAVGKHLMKKPANTIGDIVSLTMALVDHGDRILEADL
jgi:acyl carrier protein